jgi:hypothetical protein
VRSYALDPKNAEALWKKSEEMVGELLLKDDGMIVQVCGNARVTGHPEVGRTGDRRRTAHDEFLNSINSLRSTCGHVKRPVRDFSLLLALLKSTVAARLAFSTNGGQESNA